MYPDILKTHPFYFYGRDLHPHEKRFRGYLLRQEKAVILEIRKQTTRCPRVVFRYPIKCFEASLIDTDVSVFEKPVFIRPRDKRQTLFLKTSTLEGIFESFVFGDRKRHPRVDKESNQILLITHFYPVINALSKVFGYTWTEPEWNEIRKIKFCKVFQ